jgi:hypothetical protein
MHVVLNVRRQPEVKCREIFPTIYIYHNIFAPVLSVFSYLFIVYLTRLCVVQTRPIKHFMLVLLTNNVLNWTENECIVH